jgi:molecular chaperone DnaK (HSP70)
MIEYVFKNFAKEFAKIESDFEAPLDIVLAGGTSMPKGFRNKVQTIVNSLDLPFEVKEVKHASDPRNAVVKGCLTQAIISQKKFKEKSAKTIAE